MSKLSGLRKVASHSHNNAEEDSKIDAFIDQAALKTEIVSEIDPYKHAKRDQSFLLKLNHYEVDLINQVFDKSNYRSKLELARSILIPALEKKFNEEAE